jgi:DNA polymerase elongation subunit (family B)
VNKVDFKSTLKNKHNFSLVNVDTDSIAFAREDGSPFTPEDQEKLLNLLNSEFPELINFAHDGYFKRGVVLASKNYWFVDPENPNPKKRSLMKGNSIKATRKEIYLQEFIKKVLNVMLVKGWTYNQVLEIYEQTARECLNLQTMAKHSFKTSITEAVLRPQTKIAETTSLKIKVALKGLNYQQGDKFRMFFLSNGHYCLESNFKGEYDDRRLLEKLWDTMQSFEQVIPMELFPKYSLIRGDINYYTFSGKEKPKKVPKTKKVVD